MAEAGLPDPTVAHPWPNSSTHRQDIYFYSTAAEQQYTPPADMDPVDTTNTKNINCSKYVQNSFSIHFMRFPTKNIFGQNPSNHPTVQHQFFFSSQNRLKIDFLYVSRYSRQITILDRTHPSKLGRKAVHTARANGRGRSTGSDGHPPVAEKQYTPPEPMAEAGPPGPTVAHPWPKSSTHRLSQWSRPVHRVRRSPSRGRKAVHTA